MMVTSRERSALELYTSIFIGRPRWFLAMSATTLGDSCT